MSLICQLTSEDIKQHFTTAATENGKGRRGEREGRQRTGRCEKRGKRWETENGMGGGEKRGWVGAGRQRTGGEGRIGGWRLRTGRREKRGRGGDREQGERRNGERWETGNGRGKGRRGGGETENGGLNQIGTKERHNYVL